MSSNPSVEHFFEKFPTAREIYAATPLNHLTHSHYAQGIQAEGLRPNTALFPASHGAFLMDILHKYGSQAPGDRDYIQNRILDPSRVYLYTVKPSAWQPEYGIPERMMLMMRGLASLATKASLTEGERNFASQALAGHEQTLTTNDPAIVKIQVGPFAPAVLDSRFGAYPLDTVPDREYAEEVAGHIDSQPYNIPVTGAIGPEHISIVSRTPIDAQRVMRDVYAEPGWTSSIS